MSGFKVTLSNGQVLADAKIVEDANGKKTFRRNNKSYDNRKSYK